ncbi:hypothetical protein IWX91DRAFT_171654 [Phyllosticta citricarpa]
MLRTAIRLLYAISLGAESAPKKANFAHFAYFARFILPGGLHPPLWSSVSSLNSACVLLSSLFACQLGLVLFCIRARCSKETRDATGSEFRLQGRRWPVPGLPLGFILRRRPPASTSSLSRLLFQSRVLQRHCKRHRFINSSMVCRPNEGTPYIPSVMKNMGFPLPSSTTRRRRASLLPPAANLSQSSMTSTSTSTFPTRIDPNAQPCLCAAAVMQQGAGRCTRVQCKPPSAGSADSQDGQQLCNRIADFVTLPRRYE